MPISTKLDETFNGVEFTFGWFMCLKSICRLDDGFVWIGLGLVWFGRIPKYMSVIEVGLFWLRRKDCVGNGGQVNWMSHSEQQQQQQPQLDGSKY